MREQRRPAAPPDRRPARRGGGSSPCTHFASAAGRPADPARLYGPRRGLVRSARALAAAALLALSGALALPATAQADVLVSNIGQSDSLASVLNDTFYLGQAFSVGADGGNYTLTSIEIPFRNAGIAAADIGSLSVSVWSTGSSGFPSALLHTLMKPASITAGTTVTFNAQAGATLEAGTTYAVVVYFDKDLSQDPGWALTGSGEDANPAMGWEIADSRMSRRASGTTWSNSSSTSLHKIRVNGTAAGRRDAQQRPGILRRARGVHLAGEQRRGHRCRHGDGDGRQQRHADLQPGGDGRGFVRHRFGHGRDQDQGRGDLQLRGEV